MNSVGEQVNSNGNIPSAGARIGTNTELIRNDIAKKKVKITAEEAFAEEMNIMVKLNRQIISEDSQLAVIGEELLIPAKLRKKYKHQIKQTPHYLAKLDLIQVRFDQHECLLPDLETRYITSLSEGLTSAEAQIRLRRRGNNEITVSPTISSLSKYAQYVFSGMNALLLTAMILFAVAYYLYWEVVNLWVLVPLGSILLVCILCASLHDRNTTDLGNIPVDLSVLTGRVCVVRDGKNIFFKTARKIVTGDIVILGPGDRVPADLRVTSASSDFAVDAILFGQKNISKNSEISHHNPFDASNLLFLGSTVVQGTCRGLVLHCGDKCTVAKLVRQIKVSRKYQAASKRDLHFYYKAITGITLSFALFFVIIGVWVAEGSSNSSADVNWTVSQKLGAVLQLVAGVVVASIPLWFQLVLLVGQRATESRLAALNVFVKNLDVLNSLSALAVLCVTDSSVPDLSDLGVYVVPILAGKANVQEDPKEDPKEDPPKEELTAENSSEEECLVSPQVLEALKTNTASVRRSMVHDTKAITGRNEWTNDHLSTMTVSGSSLTDRRLHFLLSSKTHKLVFDQLDPMQQLRVVVGFNKSNKFGTVAFFTTSTADAVLPCIRAAQLGIGPSRLADVSASAENLPEAILETRRGFNNLRRSLMFLLASVVPRLMPLLVAIAFNLPLAISAVLVIAGSLAVDLWPAIALLFDPAELDVGLRKPRHEEKDKFISQRMILVSLCFFGPMGVLAGFLSYSLAMSDFGFDPNGLGGFTGGTFVRFGNISTTAPGFPTSTGYALDLTLAELDNVHLCGRVGGTGTIASAVVMNSIPYGERCGGDVFTLETFNEFCYSFYPKLFLTNAIRQNIAFYENQKNSAGVLFERNVTANGLPICGSMNYDGVFIPFGFLPQDTQTIVDKSMNNYGCTNTDSRNAVNGLPVCFTNEALLYAQTAYFATIAAFTLSVALLALRTELFSFFTIGFIHSNIAVLASVLLSFGIVVVIIYIPAINTFLQTRPTPVSSLFIGALPFITYAFLLEEVRKNFIRRNTKWGRWLMKRTMW